MTADPYRSRIDGDCTCCRVLSSSLRSATPEAVFIIGMTTGYWMGREPDAFEPMTLCPRHEDMFRRVLGRKPAEAVTRAVREAGER